MVLRWIEMCKYNLPNLDLYENLYENSPKVMDHLEKCYTLVFQFYVSVYKSLKPLDVQKAKKSNIKGFTTLKRALGHARVFAEQTRSTKFVDEYEEMLRRLRDAEKQMRRSAKLEEITLTRKRDEVLLESVGDVNGKVESVVKNVSSLQNHLEDVPKALMSFANSSRGQEERALARQTSESLFCLLFVSSAYANQ
jgi:hypothetical protein